MVIPNCSFNLHSLIISDVEHLFMFLLSSLEEFLSRSSALHQLFSIQLAYSSGSGSESTGKCTSFISGP